MASDRTVVLTVENAKFIFAGWLGNVNLLLYAIHQESLINPGGRLFFQYNTPDFQRDRNWQPVTDAGYLHLFYLILTGSVPRPGIDLPGVFTANYSDGQGVRYWSPKAPPDWMRVTFPQDKPRKKVVALVKKSVPAGLLDTPGVVVEDSSRRIRWPNRGE